MKKLSGHINLEILSGKPNFPSVAERLRAFSIIILEEAITYRNCHTLTMILFLYVASHNLNVMCNVQCQNRLTN